jgi:predicted lipase
MTNINVDQETYNWYNKSEVHSGFYEAYQLLQDDLRQTLSLIIDEHPFSTILVTGHSLGSALALLGAIDIKMFF